MSASAEIDMTKLNEFLGKAVIDLGATLSAGLVVIGDKLGLYKAMAGAGPMTPAELAARTKTDERYVREWLSAQASGGYVTYDPATQRFELPPEQAFALANPDGPGFFPAGMQVALAALTAEPHIIERF
jgi:hypothetical protein